VELRCPGDFAAVAENQVMTSSKYSLQLDLLVFDDVKQLKDWLKSVKRALASSRFDDLPF
jgi:hypothetical protein